MADDKTKTGIVFIFIITVVESQITSSLVAQTVCVGDDVELDWVYGNAADISSVTWSHTNSSSNTKTIMQLGLGGGTPTVIDNFNVVHKSNGGITLTNVNEGNSGSYKISVTYLSVSPVEDSVSVTVKDCSKCTCDCRCKKKCKGIVIPSIVFGGLGAVTLTVVIGGTVTEHFGRITALVVDVIGIVFDVITSVLGIVVQGQDCCENAEDCCEDSDCCEVECEKNWIETTALVFIIIGILVGIASGVIFYLVWSGRIGRGNNGGNGFFCFNNGNDDGNDSGNDSGNNGHHRGRGTNSSTVHTERADTHRGTLSDRANSDSEVSRKDVHVQENRDNFSGRPMPPIPSTDKKGRGLSANFDDDHPMITVGIPDKKAGDLEPLPEESIKKRKKKKKAVNDDNV